MRKEDKQVIIDNLAAQLKETPNFYVTDASGLNAEKTAALRKVCFEQDIQMVVVKNSLFFKALQLNNIEGADELAQTLVGPTAILFSDSINAPAKLIKDFGAKNGKPVLKGAYVQENVYVGANQLDTLVAIKSREELIGDVVGLILSPGQRLVSAITSSGNNIAGIVKAIAEREEA